MADKKRPDSALSPATHQNGGVGSPTSHCNSSLEGRPGHHSPGVPPQSASSSRATASSPALRALRTLGGLVTPLTGTGSDISSARPRGQSLSSALSSRTRTASSKSKRRSSQQEEPEALLDLILESQGQRLEDQRASLSLLPDPGPAAPCGACSSDQPAPPGLDFYYMLIHYQSDRMEDQRCSLPDLDDVAGSGPDGQETFFSLVQRVQSRRMDEQRALLTHTCSSSPCLHHHRHHHSH